MSSDSSRPERNVFSIGSILSARIDVDGTAVGDHASGQFGGVGQPVSEPVLFAITDRDIALPPQCSPFVEHLLERASIGGFVFLGRYGHRIAAVIPADVAESILAEGTGEDDDDDPPARTGSLRAAWAGWHRHGPRTGPEPAAGVEEQSLLQAAISAGEIQPPEVPGWPEAIPELADLPSLSDSLIATRERERGR